MSQNNYKCIRSYPGGPDVGYISKPKELNDELDFNSHYYNHYWFDPKLYPEDWKLLVEKDYEIMSLKYKYQNGDIKFAFLQGNGNYVITSYMFYGKDYKYGSTLERCLATDWTIQSVKRLSDGEIFSIGDKCHLNNGNGCRNPISKFEIRNNNYGLEKYRNRDRVVVFLETFSGKIWGPLELDSLVHSKEPLFTTEDGVDIIDDNQLVYLVHKESMAIHNNYSRVILSFISDYLVFSTEDSRKSYISNNKPQYSKKDMLSIITYSRGFSENVLSSDIYERWLNSPYKIKK